MKPICLTLSGLQSYVEEQTVDFRQMQGCGLFGIFGPTGSGKSTILDGMTLALYGSVSRASHNTQGIINSISDTVRVSFTFELMMQGKPQFYRIERAYRRKKQAPDSCEPKLSRLSRLADPDDEAGTVLADKSTEVNEAIEKLLGLHYDDFTRAVVLPQNQFQEFLLLGKKDKSDMLERLFCLEEYGQELSRKIAVSRRKAEDGMRLAAGALDVLKDCTDEAVLAARQEAQERTEAKIKAAQHHEISQQAYLAGQTVFQLSRRKEELLGRMSLLDKQAVSIGQARQQLAMSQLVEPVWPLCLEEKELDTETIQLEGSIKSLMTQITVSGQELEQCLRTLEEYQATAAGQKSAWELQLHKLEQASGLIRQKDLLTERSAGLSHLLEELVEQEKQSRELVLTLKLENDQQQQTLQHLQSTRQSCQVDPARRQILEHWVQAHEQMKQIQQDLQVETLEAEKLAEQQQQLNDRLELSRHLVSAEDTAIFSRAASRLAPGERCPVCGSTEHPDLAHLRNETSAFFSEDERIKLQRQAAQAEERLLASRRQQDRLIARKNELAVETGKILEKFPDLQNLPDPAAHLQQLYQQENEQADLDRKIQLLMTGNLEGRERLQQEAEQQIRLAGQITGQQQLCRELETQLTHLQAELVRNLPDWSADQYTLDLVYKETARHKQMIADQEQTGKQLAGRYQNLAERKQEIERQVVIFTTQLQMKQERQVRVSAQLAAAAAENGFVDVAALIAARMAPEEARQLETRLRQYDNDRRDIQLQIRQCDDQLKGGWLEEPAWRQIEAEFKAAVQSLEQAVRQDDLARHRLDELIAREAVRKQKEREYNTAVSRRERIGQIESLVRGNAFVQYVAEERLRTIASEATEYLQTMTHFRYALELDSDMAFIIRDQLNGGEVRLATSLSGGETFMASLALALALSSQIQIRGQSRLAFFFLDEGFGSLDSNLLDLVMDALERISSPQRMIGLISHVPELKNRISTRLVITPANSREGSRIRLERD